MLLMLVGFVIFTVIAVANWVMAWPHKRDELLVDVESEAEELAELAALKARCLQDIRDLEFDFQTGHLTEEDYRLLRDRLERQAISVMKRLDRLRGDTDYDARIDAGYAERFEVAPWDAPGSAAEEPEAGAVPVKPAAAHTNGSKPAPAATSAKPGKAGKAGKATSKKVAAAPVARAGERACPSCGHGMEVDALFCSQCGHKMPPATPSCRGCGEALDEDARFCKHCGTAVDASPAASVHQEA